MGNITGILLFIAIFLACQWLVNIDKKDELHRIWRELNRIADILEQRGHK